MLKIEHTEVVGWEAAIRGMRNPKNSWEKSDSQTCTNCNGCLPGQECERYKNGTFIGPNDLDLMTRLRNAGTDHRKFMRMITVYLDITAPLYWWKEFKTYRFGRKFGDDEPDIVDEGYLEYDIEMNSCSTMHKIADKEFTFDDFSVEQLLGREDDPFTVSVSSDGTKLSPIGLMLDIISMLNGCRAKYLKTKDKNIGGR